MYTAFRTDRHFGIFALAWILVWVVHAFARLVVWLVRTIGGAVLLGFEAMFPNPKERLLVAAVLLGSALLGLALWHPVVIFQGVTR